MTTSSIGVYRITVDNGHKIIFTIFYVNSFYVIQLFEAIFYDLCK